MPQDHDHVVPLTITANELSSWPGYLEPHDLHAIARSMWRDLSGGCTFGKKSVLYPKEADLWTSAQYLAVREALAGERLAWKLSALSAVGPKYAAVKLVGANGLNRHLGLDRSKSTIVLFDKMSMRPLCLMAGSQISAARTGTYASVVAEIFFNACERFNVFVFGAGPIARWVCLLLGAIRGGNIERVWVRARSLASAQQLATSLAHLPFPLTPVATSDALRDADLVITATNAQSPVFAQAQIKPNGLVLHLGGDETPAGHLETMVESGILACDDVDMVLERGTSSLAHYCAASQNRPQPSGVLENVKGLAGLIEKRTIPVRPAHITCVGLPSLDLYVAQHVYETFLVRHPHEAQSGPETP